MRALDRLRAYQPPPTQYDSAPLSRRAAVLLLLFADRRGDLRIVLTMRASTLSSYSGHAAFPGGRAEGDETAVQTARREAAEEIGLPADDNKLPYPFTIEHLCELPANLARTELVVRPCVAFLHSYDGQTGVDASVDETLIPRLDAKEVAAVFSAPFHNFLLDHDENIDASLPERPQDWYKGAWTDWHQTRWRMHYFYVPITNQRVTTPQKTDGQKMAVSKLANKKRYQVWGMTARMLVDAATLAYGEKPKFDHNAHFGDEDMISRLRQVGRLGEVRRPNDELTSDVMEKAANL